MYVHCRPRGRERAMNAQLPSISHYLAEFLSRRAAPLPEDLRPLLDQLCDGALNQNSCLDVSHLSDEARERLGGLACVDDGAGAAPLALQGDRLYLQRYLAWEKGVAARLLERNRHNPCDSEARLRKLLDQRFPQGDGDGQQRVAALQALTRQLLIITGGPGTGKTRTIAGIIAMLLALAGDKKPVIRIAAPTGKAAMRLKEALGAETPDLPPPVTLHRLLGMRPDGSCRHDARNPLVADVLIVDEASMIDLPMAHRLFSALPAETRLVLSGDADQLPSIDVGSVLADLCVGVSGYSQEFADFAAKFGHKDLPVERREHGLRDSVCRFEHNYRFDPNSGIGGLARELRAGRAAFGRDEDSVRHVDLETLLAGNPAEQFAAWHKDYLDLLAEVAAGRRPADAGELMRVLTRMGILCSRREGDSGAVTVNLAVEKVLEARGLKQPGQDFYTGKPIMVTRNDYQLGVFNGDLGICAPGPGAEGAEGAEFMAVFPDLLDQRGEVKQEPVQRLAFYETCFAMTVHKSQGSEFNHVALLLDDAPEESKADQLQSRALLYTAATRAKERLTLCGNARLWQRAVNNTRARASGLRAFL